MHDTNIGFTNGIVSKGRALDAIALTRKINACNFFDRQKRDVDRTDAIFDLDRFFHTAMAQGQSNLGGRKVLQLELESSQRPLLVYLPQHFVFNQGNNVAVEDLFLTVGQRFKILENTLQLFAGQVEA